MGKKIALIGASGFVGSAILRELLERGFQVLALVRNPDKIAIKDPNLAVKKVDVGNMEALAADLKGYETVSSAYNPGWANPNIYADTLENYPKILEAAKKAGVKRLLVVGGGGTLFIKPGLRLMDSGTLPREWLPAVRSLGEFYLNTLARENGIDWVFFSPAANLLGQDPNNPGKRTGKYRLGKNDLITDAKGDSSISVQDYAKAMVDEAETPAHHKERFTIGY